MTNEKLITPEMVLDVTNKHAAGWSYRQISDWLMTAHKVKYSHVSVARAVQQNISKRRQLSEDILKPYLEKSLTSDLELLQDLIRDASRIKKEAMKSGEPRLALAAIDRLTKLADMRLKMSGAHKEETTVETLEVDWKEMNDKYGISKKEPEPIDAEAELITEETE